MAADDASTVLHDFSDEAVVDACVLYVTEGADGDRGAHVSIGEDEVVVGSAGECDLALSDAKVSRRHAAFRLTSGGIVVRDLGSKNGTHYLGNTIQEAVLKPGARLAIGDTIVMLLPPTETENVPASDLEHYGQLVGRSLPMRKLFTLLQRLETSDAPVLVNGETGTGKELVAQALHDNSPRKDRPFIVLDCGAIPEGLAGSELFGHTKGAFTGANANRQGAFEQAHGGTLFLDEIGELPLALQPQLLRALESGTVKRVGDNERRAVDVRIVAATNRDLAEEVRSGRFREDLYYRLAVIRLKISPLRERREDIHLLAEHFATGMGRTETIPDNVASMMLGYEWPGNVRELRNAVMQLLSLGVVEPQGVLRPLVDSTDEIDVSVPYKEAREKLVNAFEVAYVKKLLEHTSGGVSAAARKAGLSRKYLRDLMNKHGIGRPDEGD